ncbi:hypothetical protein BDW62DRAFT_220456 [Aspergillus aurantiobrunneus]
MSAKDCLRKSKSTRFHRLSHNSSLTAEPFDPELARLFATAAASRAMAMSRSTERSTTLSEGSYDRLGGARSMAVPPRRYKRSSYSSGCSSATDELPMCRSTSTAIESPVNGQTWSAALPSISEFGGLEDRVASLPSSYRRLRKSRSMFSTRQRSSHIPYVLNSPESYSPSISSRGQTSDPPRLYRTLRRSMSFLRNDNRHQNTLRHAKSQDAAIQLARSQYQQNLLDSPDPPKWAPLPMSKVRREHKPFRRTFRATSTSENTSTTEASVEQIKTSQSHGKARAFSTSIKKGIKRVLGLSRDASGQEKSHASPSSSYHQDQSPSNAVSNETDYVGDYGSFNINHLHERADVNQPPTVRRMQSSGSLATSRSRVTSWADSTAANTIATPKTDGQRLSIISEQGNLGRPELPPLPPGSIRQRPNNAVDSHRLFSALMKRIGGPNAQASEEDILLGQVKEHRAIPTQESLHFHRSKQTIRQVPSDSSINSPKSFATANPGPITPYGHPQDHGIKGFRGVTRLGDAFEDDNGAVRKENIRAESVSPSVYSQSTNGRPRSRATNSPDSAAEQPGVATIYASERTAYSSPNKIDPSQGADTSAQSGTDWQNWMDSQIARIENATPTRHYRENAEIQGDCAPKFASSVPTRRIRVESRGKAEADCDRDRDHDGLSRRASTCSNFSRPFSRSSSLRTVVKVREPSSKYPTPSMPPLTADDVFRGSGGQEQFLISTQAGQSNIEMSPMLSRSSNQPRAVESPTPKRSAVEDSPTIKSTINNQRSGTYSAKWSPGAQDTRTLHRRSARFLRENRRATNENARLEQGMYDQAYGLQSPMSSKRMVEIFLNSRRRQMGAGSDDGISDPAFL